MFKQRKVMSSKMDGGLPPKTPTVLPTIKSYTQFIQDYNQQSLVLLNRDDPHVKIYSTTSTATSTTKTNSQVLVFVHQVVLASTAVVTSPSEPKIKQKVFNDYSDHFTRDLHSDYNDFDEASSSSVAFDEFAQMPMAQMDVATNAYQMEGYGGESFGIQKTMQKTSKKNNKGKTKAKRRMSFDDDSDYTDGSDDKNKDANKDPRKYLSNFCRSEIKKKSNGDDSYLIQYDDIYERVDEFEGLITFYSVVKSDRYLISKFVNSKVMTLSQYMVKQSDIMSPSSEWDSILRGVLLGLQFIHDSIGSVHKNLTPDSIFCLLNHNNGLDRVVIGNYGAGFETVIHDYLPNDEYVSESVEQDGYTKYNSDIYGFGVIALQLITGLSSTEVVQTVHYERKNKNEILDSFYQSFQELNQFVDGAQDRIAMYMRCIDMSIVDHELRNAISEQKEINGDGEGDLFLANASSMERESTITQQSVSLLDSEEFMEEERAIPTRKHTYDVQSTNTSSRYASRKKDDRKKNLHDNTRDRFNRNDTMVDSLARRNSYVAKPMSSSVSYAQASSKVTQSSLLGDEEFMQEKVSRSSAMRENDSYDAKSESSSASYNEEKKTHDKNQDMLNEICMLERMDFADHSLESDAKVYYKSSHRKKRAAGFNCFSCIFSCFSAPCQLISCCIPSYSMRSSGDRASVPATVVANDNIVAPPHTDAPVIPKPMNLEQKNKYKVKQRIGSGAQGLCLLVEYESQEYVMKRYAAGVDGEYYQELRVLQSLQHENIAQFCEAIEVIDEYNSHTKYIVMHYYNKGDLQRFMKKYHSKKPLTFEKLRLYMTQMMKGVSHLHENKYIHRDLKPANILLSDKNLVIADFGFTTHESNLNPILGGTPAYMAPEQSPQHSGDYKIDVWACGCIAFELITRSVKQMRKLSESSGNNPLWFKDLWTLHVSQNEEIQNLYPQGVMDCLVSMLQVDPNKRISAQDSLQQWISLGPLDGSS